jgi:peptidoglycan/LPS O-acetylase OafA/YrhL
VTGSGGDTRPVDEGAAGAGFIPSFDGLRGAACLLVVLSHAWTIVPADVLRETGPADGLFLSGNLGVTIFFVLGGFLVTRGLLGEFDRNGHISRARFWWRRLVRLCAPLYLLIAVVYVISLVDPADPWSAEQTNRSLLTIGSFTFNWSLVDSPLANRPDLGHLWYLSVEQQFYVVFVIVVGILGRHRAGLVALLTAATVAVTIYRWQLVESHHEWAAELRTFTRSDGLMLGALAALLLPHLHRFANLARRITAPAAVALFALVLSSPHLEPHAFLKTQGILFAILAATLVAAVAVTRNPTGPVERALATRPLRLLGVVSYSLYLWHFPVFWASARWAEGLDWQPRAVATCAVLALVVALTNRVVEDPIRRLLARPRPTAAVLAGPAPAGVGSH